MNNAAQTPSGQWTQDQWPSDAQTEAHLEFVSKAKPYEIILAQISAETAVETAKRELAENGDHITSEFAQLDWLKRAQKNKSNPKDTIIRPWLIASGLSVAMVVVSFLCLAIDPQNIMSFTLPSVFSKAEQGEHKANFETYKTQQNVGLKSQNRLPTTRPPATAKSQTSNAALPHANKDKPTPTPYRVSQSL